MNRSSAAQQRHGHLVSPGSGRTLVVADMVAPGRIKAPLPSSNAISVASSSLHGRVRRREAAAPPLVSACRRHGAPEDQQPAEPTQGHEEEERVVATTGSAQSNSWAPTAEAAFAGT